MAENYFEFLKENCGAAVIKNVCIRYPVVKKLEDSLKSEWGCYPELLSDADLLYDIAEVFRSSELVDFRSISTDFQKVYARCDAEQRSMRKSFRENSSLEYSKLFDILTEVCWLISSVEKCMSDRRKTLCLIRDFKEIAPIMKEYLEKMYNRAIENHDEYVYINDALEYKNDSIILKFSKSHYERTWQYIKEGWSIQELERELVWRKDQCLKLLRQYYCFTMTLAMAERTRRISR